MKNAVLGHLSPAEPAVASQCVLGDAHPGGKDWICCRDQVSGPTGWAALGRAKGKGLSPSLCSVPAPAPAFCQIQLLAYQS